MYTLRGPRQVGKTTALKLMIQRSAQEAADDEALYYSCDLDEDPDTIREVVQTAKRLPPQDRWWFFLHTLQAKGYALVENPVFSALSVDKRQYPELPAVTETTGGRQIGIDSIEARLLRKIQEADNHAPVEVVQVERESIG